MVRSRILCLGNDLLADDALGALVAERARGRAPAGVEVEFTPEAGFALLDLLTGVSTLVVVDTVPAGGRPPGEIRILRADEVRVAPGDSAHYVGIFEALAVARKLGMAVPHRVVLIVVTAADLTTVGGTMHSHVRAAVDEVVALAVRLTASRTSAGRAGSARRRGARSR